MGNVRPPLNEPVIQDRQQSNELPISAPWNVIFRTDIPNITLVGIAVRQVGTEVLLAGGGLEQYESDSERPVTIERKFDRFFDSAEVGMQAEVLVVIITENMKFQVFKSLKYTLVK